MTNIVIALIAASATVMVALIERVRRQNHREHGQTGSRLEGLHYELGHIHGKLDAVHDKIDTHLDDHRRKK